MKTISAMSVLVIKELYRRKDFYVLFVLTALLTLLMGAISFFNDPTIVRHLKDICLLLIWLSALVIVISTTARQIPAERENRTIFPLLAKPITRGQVIMGKALGCWIAGGIALVVFYTFFAVISGTREQNWPLLQYMQALWLHWAMLAIVVSLALLGSVVLSAPSANTTICFIAVLGILLLGRHLNKVALAQPEPVQTVTYAIYFLIPHLEWYDIRDFLVYGKMVAWGDCILATLYAALYSAALLVSAWVVFRRKAVNL